MTAGQVSPWTILRVLRWAENYLQRQGINEPRASAALLLAHCLHCTRLDLYLRYDQPLSAAELECYKRLLRRRLAHEPIQYITGHQEFWSLDFLVSPAVLIPRPETELIAEAVLKYAADRPHGSAGRRLLDVGTGSGILAVVLAKELPQAQVVAVDQSAAALALARKNIHRHGVQDRVALVQGDLLTPLASQPCFDIIVSNPPYVPTPDWEQLPADIRDYEPRLALDGGADGLAVLRLLAAAAHQYLRPGGLLALEVGQGQAETVAQLLTQTGAYGPVHIIPDYQRLGRIVTAQRRADPD
ncbi:MAG: peptide chain release factor N(5)-glutamine methyltransferase [Desulfobacca sp.]|uniref:peptide chain release factor N(5)-glutamine methyltransferase n=1 Tax=Desulfobacca sp. TaxID=2067990 RepID=UPI00404A85CD